jgi:hypothetical protein
MTRQRSFKRLVRERMAKTGERYTAARRQLLTGSDALQTSDHDANGATLHLAGIDPETTALRILLANRDVTAPHHGELPSEALLFGVAGGIGAGVFTFRYESVSTLFVGGRHLWQDGHAYVVGACERLGLPIEVHETGSARRAVEQLEAALAEGPALAWLDGTRLPHRGNVGNQDESGYHAVTVYTHDGDGALIGDLAPQPIRVPAADLAEARGRVRKFRHRLLTLGADARIRDLEGAIRAGLHATVDGLEHPDMGSYSARFRLDAFATLADDLRGGGKRGWATVFPRGRRLWVALISLYRYLEHEGSGGGLMRPLFADFLDEAAAVLGNDRSGAAEHYRSLGAGWSELARAALPEDAPLLGEARTLIDGIDEAFFEQSGEAEDGVREMRARLIELGDEAERAFPLSEADTDALLADLAGRLRELHRSELEGLAMVKGIVGG